MKYSRIDKRKNKKLSTKWIVAILVGIVIGASCTYYFTMNSKEESHPAMQNEQPVEPAPNNPAPEDIPTKETVENEQPQVDEAGYAIISKPVTEPAVINGIIVANKKYPLPKDYNKGEDPEAVKAYQEMEVAAKKAGYAITAFSGFRSYEYQQQLYDNYVARDGQEKADRYSARPGNSEHQTGLAFDIGEVSRKDLWLTEKFGETPAGQWLASNAHKYGFILRYPKGKEDITGFMYESWHFRYVGQQVATDIKKAGVTLEEYLNID